MRLAYPVAYASLLGAPALAAAAPSDLAVRYAESLAQTTSAGRHEQQAAHAQAQSQAAALKLIAGMPKCGLLCVEAAVEASPCSFADTACACGNATIAGQTARCIMARCTVKESLSTKNISDTICGKPVRDKSGIATGSGLGGMIFALVTFIVRIVSKIHIQLGAGRPITTELWWDDLAVTLSVLFVVGFCVLAVPLTQLGYARDVWTVPFENLSPIIKLMWADEILYVFGLGMVKISLLLTYLRFFSSDRFRHITYGAIGLNVAFVIAFFIVVMCQCRPMSYIWNSWDGEHEGSCLPINPVVWSSAVINIVLDFLVLGLPIVQLWRMNLNLRKKLLVIFMFGVGFLVTIISILRLHAIVGYGENKNFTWVRVEPGVWSKLELQLSVICACMPAIRQVIRRFSPGLIGSTRGEGTTTMGTSTTQSGLSGRTSFWMMPMQSNVQERRLNNETGTIAISDLGKDADTEYLVPLEEIRPPPPQSKSAKSTVSQVS